jgi:hypothetical protein
MNQRGLFDNVGKSTRPLKHIPLTILVFSSSILRYFLHIPGENPRIIMESIQAKNPRQQLRNALRGQTVIIPDIDPIMAHWAWGMNPEVERLSSHVEEYIER